MLIHLFKKLFSKKYRNELCLRKQAQIELEFEQLFLKLSDMFFRREDSDPYIDLLLGGYEIDGSWLGDSIYLDIHKKDKRLGRIHVGPGLFKSEPLVYWRVLGWPENEFVFKKKTDELITNDLAHAINSIVPKLVLTWFHEGKRMISVDIEIPDLSSIMRLPEKE
jgi:hypothetical protein